MPRRLNEFNQALLACFCALALSACNTNTEITRSYIDPELKNLDIKGVLVVGIARQPANRIEFEDRFSRALDRNGVEAIASHTLLPEAKATAEQVIAAAKKANLDTILVTRYIGEKTQDVYHPGTIYYGVTPAYGYNHYGNFGGYYGQAYEVAYEQPVWTANVSHTMVSDLYLVKTQDHLWQAVSDTIESGSTSQVVNDTIDALIKNLKQKELLQ